MSMNTPELHPSAATTDACAPGLPKSDFDSSAPSSSAHFRSSQLFVCGFLAFVFFYYSALLLLAPNDVWINLKYGEWIVTNGELPENELFSLFADPEGPYANFQWLA